MLLYLPFNPQIPISKRFTGTSFTKNSGLYRIEYIIPFCMVCVFFFGYLVAISITLVRNELTWCIRAWREASPSGWAQTNGQVMINNHTTVGAWSGGVELNGMWFRCLVFQRDEAKRRWDGCLDKMLEWCLHLDVSYSFQCDEWLMISLANGEVIS